MKSLLITTPYYSAESAQQAYDDLTLGLHIIMTGIGIITIII